MEGLEDARSEVRNFLDQFDIYYIRTSEFGGDSNTDNVASQKQKERDPLFDDDEMDASTDSSSSSSKNDNKDPGGKGDKGRRKKPESEESSDDDDDADDDDKQKGKGKGKGKHGGPAAASSCPIRDKNKIKNISVGTG